MQTLNNTITETAAGYRNYMGGYLKVLISHEQTNGALSIIDATMPKGSEPPLHIHLNEDEAFYVLEGEVLFQVGDEIIIAKAGEAAFGPKGIPHLFKIQSQRARILITLTPGGFADYFIEFSQPSIGELTITPPQGPPPPEAIEYMSMVLREKYNVLFNLNR